MIPLSATGLRGREAVVTSAPFVWVNGERQFHELPNVMSIGTTGLLVSDTPSDTDEGHVRILVEDAYVYLVAIECVTTIPKFVPDMTPPIPPEVCANVVYTFDGRGYPPGSFFRKLIHAIVGADPHNRNRIALGFPEWVRAVNLAQNHMDGLDMMMRANRENRPLP